MIGSGAAYCHNLGPNQHQLFELTGTPSLYPILQRYLKWERFPSDSTDMSALGALLYNHTISFCTDWLE